MCWELKTIENDIKDKKILLKKYRYFVKKNIY